MAAWSRARLAIVVVTTAVAATLGASAQAETTGPAAERTKRPHGVVLDCSTQSGRGGAPGGTFTSPNNLVVGPLAMRGAGLRPVAFPPGSGGQKFPISMRGDHQVTVEVSPRTARDTRLFYGQRRASRAITFVSCRRDAFTRNPYEPHTACCFSFWSGGVRADSPRCVHLRFWVDDEPRPNLGVIHLGVRDCR